MNTSAVKYRLYKQMLEGNITRRQHDMLLELGIVDKLKSWFGAGAEVGGDLAKLFKDKSAQKQLAAAKDNVTKAVKDVKDIAAKAGMGEDVVNQFLQSVLTGADIDPAEVGSAKPTDDGGKGGDDAGGAKPGTPVDPGKPEQAVPTLAGAAAEASGGDPEKAKADAEEKKVTPEKATEVLSKSVAKLAGVEPKAASAVIKALLDGGHLVAEGRRRGRRLFVSDVVTAIKEANYLFNLKSSNQMLLERWSHLAGISRGRILAEAFSVDDFIKDLKDVKDEKSLGAALRELKPEELEVVKKESSKVIEALKANKVEMDEKKFGDAIDKLSSGGDKEGDKKAEEAKKKFGGAFEDVKKKVGDAADEATIGKVLAALDDLDAIKIAG